MLWISSCTLLNKFLARTLEPYLPDLLQRCFNRARLQLAPSQMRPRRWKLCFKHVHSFKETSSLELHLQTLFTGEVGPNHIKVRGNIPPPEPKDVGYLMCAKIGIQQFVNIMQTTQLIWTNGNTNDAVVLRIPHHLSFEERWEKRKQNWNGTTSEMVQSKPVTLAQDTCKWQTHLTRHFHLIKNQYSGGCHSHRLYSHSCDHGSKLWPALFGSLTVDHANFWPLTFDRSDILPAKKSRYLNCNPSPRASMLENKRSAHV